MRSLFLSILCFLFLSPAVGASGGSSGGTGATYSIFSTSTDWQGLTGLSYSEYHGKFVPDKDLIGRQGLVLYYLDGFPCYGLGFAVRVWLGPNGKHDDSKIQLSCVFPPSEIKFAWRNATRDATQAQATGLLTCPVTSSGRDITIDLSKCVKESGWTQY